MSDGDLSLVLAALEAAAVSMWHTPTYRFDLRQGVVRVGHLNLRVADAAAARFLGHVGYGVDEPFRGHGLAARAVRLVLPLAAACGVDPVWITCGPDNPASRRTLERLGAELVEVVDVPADYPLPAGAVRQKCRFRLRSAGPVARSLTAVERHPCPPPPRSSRWSGPTPSCNCSTWPR